MVKNSSPDALADLISKLQFEKTTRKAKIKSSLPPKAPALKPKESNDLPSDLSLDASSTVHIIPFAHLGPSGYHADTPLAGETGNSKGVIYYPTDDGYSSGL